MNWGKAGKDLRLQRTAAPCQLCRSIRSPACQRCCTQRCGNEERNICVPLLTLQVRTACAQYLKESRSIRTSLFVQHLWSIQRFLSHICCRRVVRFQQRSALASDHLWVASEDPSVVCEALAHRSKVPTRMVPRLPGV